MCAVIQCVEDGSSVSQAACVHGGPYTTLYDRIVGIKYVMELTQILDPTCTNVKKKFCWIFW